jgi:uncharacterized protein YbaP (TraB family)
VGFRRLVGSALSLGLGIILLLVQPVLAQPPVWIVKDKNSRMILFGSVHVLPAGPQGQLPVWMPPGLSLAMTKAQDVWFELPIDPAAAAQVSQLAMAKGMLPPGQSLSQQISPEGRERLARIALRVGFRPDQLDRFQPWLAEASLAVAAFQLDGASGKDGVEQILSVRLGPKVTRKAFETPQKQIGFLASASPAEQRASLEETLRQIDEEPDAYKDLVQAWMDADLSSLDREALEPVRNLTPGLYQTLIRQRNLDWAQTLAKRMAGRGTTLVVVGVGHLIGPDGLPALLRAQGFLVEGP